MCSKSSAVGWLVAKLYKNVTSPEPLSNCTPLDYRYELIETCLQVKWHDGEQVPREVDEDSENVDHDIVAEYGEENEEEYESDVEYHEDDEIEEEGEMDD